MKGDKSVFLSVKSMHRDNYYQIKSFEKNNWWYRARRDLLDRILKSLNTVFHNSLDAGCGVGSNFEVLSKYSSNVYGIDMSDDAIELCSGKNYLKLTKMSVLDLNLDVKFDLIACMDVLEHANEDVKSVKNIVSHMSRNAILFISVPGGTSGVSLVMVVNLPDVLRIMWRLMPVRFFRQTISK